MSNVINVKIRFSKKEMKTLSSMDKRGYSDNTELTLPNTDDDDKHYYNVALIATF